MPPSVGPGGDQSSAVSSRYHIDLARRLPEAGYAALRYDPPGVGKSEGSGEIQNLETRADEAMAALHHVQELAVVRSDRVGFWAESQGAWVSSIAAADNPRDVAFFVSVSGSGVSVAEQQIDSIEVQTRAAGVGEEDIERAVLVGQLLIDLQLTEPRFRDPNEQALTDLGGGPWGDLSKLVYPPGTIDPAEGLRLGTKILTSIQDEPWAEFLYLKDVYIPSLRSVPRDQIEAARAVAAQSLLVGLVNG